VGVQQFENLLNITVETERKRIADVFYAGLEIRLRPPSRACLISCVNGFFKWHNLLLYKELLALAEADYTAFETGSASYCQRYPLHRLQISRAALFRRRVLVVREAKVQVPRSGH
jgi:hypothetical protein